MVEVVGNSEMSGSFIDEALNEILVFTVRHVRLGVPAVILDHVIRMVAITPIHDGPRGIMGIINYHGDVLPVFSFRKYLALEEKPPDIDDYLVIVKEERTIAIIAEHITGVYHLAHDIISPEDLSPGLKGFSGIYRCKDGLLVITHPKDLICMDDQEKIRAMKESLIL